MINSHVTPSNVYITNNVMKYLDVDNIDQISREYVHLAQSVIRKHLKTLPEKRYEDCSRCTPNKYKC